GGDQQQTEQREQGQRLAQPAQAAERGEGRQQRDGQTAQAAAQAEGGPEQQQDQRAGSQLEQGGLQTRFAEQLVELGRTIDQLDTRHLQRGQRFAVQRALQADDARHPARMFAQPERTPGLAKRAGQGRVDVLFRQRLQGGQLGIQLLRGHAQRQQRPGGFAQRRQRLQQLLLLLGAGQVLAERLIATQLAGFAQRLEGVAQLLFAGQQLFRVFGAD